MLDNGWHWHAGNYYTSCNELDQIYTDTNINLSEIFVCLYLNIIFKLQNYKLIQFGIFNFQNTIYHC